MSEIIKIPEYEKIKKEIESLRKKVSSYVENRDELKFHVSKNIETEYMLKFGPTENKVFEAEYLARRLKRKLEIIIALRNREESINLKDIEAQLDKEFEEFQWQSEEMFRAMNEAMERDKQGKLSEEEAKELKSLYRKIVKALHPDLHPDISKEKLELLYKAVEAYEDGDLDRLKLIGTMINEELEPEKNEPLAELIKQKKDLEKLLKDLEEEIEQIKISYPFNLLIYLEDKESGRLKMVELEKEYKEYKLQIDGYSAEIKKYV